ncbi:MAG: NAD(P)-dependent alcohol dehydrogenase [Steroidobacteraceae bacterium]
MKAYEVRKFIGADGLVLNHERSEPEAGPAQVIVKIHAASLNYRDLSVSTGQYPGRLKPSVIPLSDGAGEIVSRGAGVTRMKVGDRVTSVFYPDWIAGAISDEVTEFALGGALDGVLAEYIALPERAVIPIPDSLTFNEAATLPSAALTAWQALIVTAGLKAGDTVLVLGTGGVSLFAIQFAKLHCATVILTSSSSAKLQRGAQLKADHLINYRENPQWDTQVLDLTGGRGVDIVIEVGGAGTLERSLRSVRKGGTVVLVGRLAGLGQVDPLPIMRRAIRLIGINVGSHETFAAMNRAIAAADLHPVIDRSFPFAEAKAAYLYMQSGMQFGKVLVTL